MFPEFESPNAAAKLSTLKSFTKLLNPNILNPPLALVFYPPCLHWIGSRVDVCDERDLHKCTNINVSCSLIVESCLFPESLLFLNLYLISSSPPLVHITPLPLFGPRIVSILPSPYFSSTQLFLAIVRDPQTLVFLFFLVLPLPLVLPQGSLLVELHQQHLLNITSSSTYSDLSSSFSSTTLETRLDLDLPQPNSSLCSLLFLTPTAPFARYPRLSLISTGSHPSSDRRYISGPTKFPPQKAIVLDTVGA
ncbi:hypothetical protein GEMRC1_000009 [Eukaryota sp. GEM-RC1]